MPQQQDVADYPDAGSSSCSSGYPEYHVEDQRENLPHPKDFYPPQHIAHEE